jgi:hypothetical protein
MRLVLDSTTKKKGRGGVRSEMPVQPLGIKLSKII